MTAYWEHFDHDADIGIRGIAPTLEQAFEQAAIAMTAVMTDPDKVAAVSAVSLTCTAPDLELLFADWINGLIYEMATQGYVFGRYQVTVDKGVSTAVAWGESVDVNKHQPAVEIKGATFTELRVYQNENAQWVAQCVVDV